MRPPSPTHSRSSAFAEGYGAMLRHRHRERPLWVTLAHLALDQPRQHRCNAVGQVSQGPELRFGDYADGKCDGERCVTLATLTMRDHEPRRLVAGVPPIRTLRDVADDRAGGTAELILQVRVTARKIGDERLDPSDHIERDVMRVEPFVREACRSEPRKIERERAQRTRTRVWS